MMKNKKPFDTTFSHNITIESIVFTGADGKVIKVSPVKWEDLQNELEGLF